jgi:hypothetical protein
MGQGYTGLKKWMQPDFKRPEFYEYILKMLGLM